MKTNLILSGALAASLALSGCAATGASNTAPPSAGFDASASQFEGWARVQNGEIRLYREQRDLTQGFSTDCVSGALPRNPQRVAGDLNGSRIRLFGRTALWSARDGSQTYNWQGSRIVNDCRRDVVILADRVEVLQ